MRLMLRNALATLCLATAALVSGCAGEATGERMDAPASEAPDGSVVAPDAGLRLTLPDGWRVVDKNAPELDEQFEAGAAMAGMSTAQFRDALDAMDLFAHSSTATLNIVVIPDDTLPSEAFLRRLHEDGGPVELDGTTLVETPVGPARQTEFHTTDTSRSYGGASIYVVVGDHLAHITVSAWDAAEGREILADVIPTLEAA